VVIAKVRTSESVGCPSATCLPFPFHHHTFHLPLNFPL